MPVCHLLLLEDTASKPQDVTNCTRERENSEP